MNNLKGFVTVATGNDKYYQLAYNLCLSYRKCGQGKYPFALICDKETKYNSFFDDVVIVEQARHSTLDKMLVKYSPYEKSIFLDADTLIINSIDNLWDIFECQNDVTAFGCKLPLDSRKGWFTYEGSGKYKSQIQYLISMNGGIYYVKKGEVADRVFEKAEELVDEYTSIDFRYFKQPADEPIMAMSMVLNQCEPCDIAYEMIILPAYSKKVTMDYCGNIYEDGKLSSMKLIHFSTPRTKLFLYQYLDEINHTGRRTKKNYLRVRFKCLPVDIKFDLRHNAGAIMRSIGLSNIVEELKTIIH
ncbi:hypothetical protein ACQRBN_04375 [Bariatricus sp. SGI.154]|uniref:hypothetical protein n=1 Tax=Bariatricus sp. SGI.154 TaxID=3420549 RepID=UPI003D06212D